jgi:hyperosmotically inducible protein
MKLPAMVVLLFAFVSPQSQSKSDSHLAIRPGPQDVNEQHIAKEVRHELLMLPYYSIFDDLEFSVNGDTVTLIGSVVNPTLKKDAENAVKHIEGVRQVNNQIKVLPPSPEDDRIRLQVARAINNQDSLYRYFQGAIGSIHIIVENGHVTLKGVVDSQADDTMAKMAANQVPGVFSVTDGLQVGNGSSGK